MPAIERVTALDHVTAPLGTLLSPSAWLHSSAEVSRVVLGESVTLDSGSRPPLSAVELALVYGNALLNPICWLGSVPVHLDKVIDAAITGEVPSEEVL